MTFLSCGREGRKGEEGTDKRDFYEDTPGFEEDVC
jgi:hypothetical protein